MSAKLMRVDDAEDTWLAALCLAPAYAETSRIFLDNLTNRGRRIYQAINAATDSGFGVVTLWKLAEMLSCKPDDDLLRSIPERIGEPESQDQVKRAEKAILEHWGRALYAKACDRAKALSFEHGVAAGERCIDDTLEEIRASVAGIHWYKPADVARELLAELATPLEDSENVQRTGWEGLDRATDYWAPKRCTIIGGFTNDGKSTLTGQILTWLALRGTSVVRIDLEDEPKIPVQRQLAALNIVSEMVMRMDQRVMTEKDRYQWDDIVRTVMEEMPMVGTHMPGANGEQVAAAIYEAGRKYQAKVVSVDYIQECSGTGEKKIYLPAALTMWKKAASDIGAHLVVVSQLARPANRDSSLPPTMYMLKESGDLENQATTVLLVHRPEKGADYNGLEHDAKVIIDKAKGGFTGHLPCHWHLARHLYLPISAE